VLLFDKATRNTLQFLLAKKHESKVVLRNSLGLLDFSVTNEDAVRESGRPYQSEPANTGLACVLLLQSQLDMTPASH